MAAINDITGDAIRTRQVTESFKNNFDKIDWSVKKPKEEVVEVKDNSNDLEEAKARFFEQWNLSGDKGEKAWQEKLEMMNKSSQYGVYVRDDIKAYQSMITGEYVEGKKAHREHLKRHNCVEAADMPLKNPERPKDNSLKERLIYEVMHNKQRKWK